MSTGDQLYDLSKGALPIVIVVAIIYAAVQIGGFIERVGGSSSGIDKRFQVVEQRQKDDYDKLAAAIDSVRASVADIHKTLTDPTARAIPTDIIRWNDMYVFCLELERANGPTFKCPNLRDR